MEGSEIADLAVKEGIQLTEAAIKLLAAGSVNLIALLVAYSKDQDKLMGQTKLVRLIGEHKPLKVFKIKEGDLEAFKSYADGKNYGVLYHLVQSKDDTSGMIDVITNVDYVANVNRIMERLGYPIPASEVGDESKKGSSRAQQKNSSQERGNGWTPSKKAPTKTSETVKGRLAAIKAANGGAKSPKIPEKAIAR